MWLSIEQASAYYGMSVGWFRNKILRGELNKNNGAHKFGSLWRIMRTQFEREFIDKSPEGISNGLGKD